MKKTQNNNCVYLHVNPIKQEVFYVGAGNEKRPYSKYGRSDAWHRTINKYKIYDIIIIHSNLSWSEACKLEIKYIAQIGRRKVNEGPLVNLTIGGDGMVGLIPWNKGLTRDTDVRVDAIAKIRDGIKLSDETKKKKSLSMLGKKIPESQKFNMANAQRERHRNKPTKDKTLIANKVWKTRRVNGTDKMSSDTKEKIRVARIGQRVSEETRLKHCGSRTSERNKEICLLLLHKTVKEIAEIYNLNILTVNRIKHKWRKENALELL